MVVNVLGKSEDDFANKKISKCINMTEKVVYNGF